jgi:hypothetical protein
MIKFLRKLLGLCDHKWEDHNKQNYEDLDPRLYNFTVIQCKCEKCGVWKSFKIMW